MVKQKSDMLSTRYKDEGNVELKKGKLREALLLYNKAICFAESKEALAFAYANRSVVYLERKLFDECLQNIQWALENNYPADKIQKLKEREEKCKKLKEAHIKDPEDDPWNFFKLSYPANPKVPFIVNRLEMRVNKKFGRGIYATDDLTTGDIIAIEDAAIRCGFTWTDTELYRCANCLKTCMLNLIPCAKTASYMFCTPECRDSTYAKIDINLLFQDVKKFNHDKIYADIEEKFGGREKLLEFLNTVRNVKKMNFSVFDFDFSIPNDPEYGANLVKCCLSFTSAFDIIPNEEIEYDEPSEDLTKGNKKIKELIKHACGIIGLLARRVSYGALGIAFGNLINHSCIPNVQRIQIDNKILFYVVKPIKEGEQLFESYYMTKDRCNYFELELEYRQLMTAMMFNFQCKCIACKQNLYRGNMDVIDMEFVENSYGQLAKGSDKLLKTWKIKHFIEQWKVNNEYINKHYKNIKSGDIPILIRNNHKIITDMAYVATFPMQFFAQEP